MYRYTKSDLNEKSGIFHRVTKHVSEGHVQNHLFLLIAQTVLLVMLALIHLSFQFQAVRLEASAMPVFKTIQNTILKNSLLAQNTQKAHNQAKNVLGSQTQKTAQQPVQQQLIPLQPTPGPQLSKSYYTIALVGDSMVDTMGEDSTYLRDALARKYPDVQFLIYNYGKGARTVTEGLEDFHEPFRYKDRNYESIDTLKPDFIIVGSFGYNVFSPPDRNRHWLEYTKLVQEAQKISSNVYMLAEIAPTRSGFGLGPEGVMWDPQRAWTHTGYIIEQLENVIGLSHTLQTPLIDTYTPSLMEGQKEGKRELINPSDNIHPSVQGHEFIAKIIAETLVVK